MDDREEAIDILTRMSTNHFYGHREQEAFKLGAEALKQRWIPVTERLPGKQGTYLVTVNDGGINVAIAEWWFNYLDNGEGYFVCDDCFAEDITAWMQLPEPYKVGEEE